MVLCAISWDINMFWKNCEPEQSVKAWLKSLACHSFFPSILSSPSLPGDRRQRRGRRSASRPAGWCCSSSMTPCRSLWATRSQPTPSASTTPHCSPCRTCSRGRAAMRAQNWVRHSYEWLDWNSTGIWRSPYCAAGFTSNPKSHTASSQKLKRV